MEEHLISLQLAGKLIEFTRDEKRDIHIRQDNLEITLKHGTGEQVLNLLSLLEQLGGELVDEDV